MTKVLRCKDVGLDCDHEMRGESVEDVLRQAAEHARSQHHVNEIPPAMLSKVRSAIHEE